MTDYLFRQPYIDLLKSIIVNQCDNPFGYSFAIDGEWGCGKTWILNELEYQLTEENKNKYLIFHYNAWENDFYDEPLVAILSIMIETLEKIFKYEKFVNEVNEKLFSITLKMLKNLAISFANVTVKDKIGVDCRDVIGDFENVKYVKSDIKNLENQIDTFLPLKNGIKEIQNQLKELSKEKTLLVVVDELDRCLPEYAIKVLERLHHICNNLPVIQVLAINKQNLSDSIAKVFGKDYIEKENPVDAGTPMISLASFSPDSSYKENCIKYYQGDIDSCDYLNPYDVLMCTTQQTDIDNVTDIIGKCIIVPDVFREQAVFTTDLVKVKVEQNLGLIISCETKLPWYNKYITGFASGTSIKHFNTAGFLNYSIALPKDVDIINKFANIIMNFKRQQSVIMKETQKLTALRDRLLPLLMNGQVEVR